MAQEGRERVIGYVRVSTEAQADGGTSLEAQRARLAAYAVALDLEVVEVIADAGYSAKSLLRPGLQRALARLGSGEANGLLITKLDRLTRSVRDLCALVDEHFRTRASLMSVGDAIDTRTASGRLVLNVLTSVAQWEREANGERTRDALAHLRREGVRLGGEALGWFRSDERGAHGRRVVRNDIAELATVERAFELREKGLSYRAIAATLAAEGCTTKRGGAWCATTVLRIVRRRGGLSHPRTVAASE